MTCAIAVVDSLVFNKFNVHMKKMLGAVPDGCLTAAVRPTRRPQEILPYGIQTLRAASGAVSVFDLCIKLNLPGG